MAMNEFVLRAAVGISFFVALGVWDLWRHPENPRRAKEYLFLFGVTAAAMTYAVMHDAITYHLSPEYFIYGKGLAGARDGFGWPVVRLALMAGWSPGLIVGATLLIANNRDAAGRQLRYPVLWSYAVVVLILSAGMAAALGCIFLLFSSRIAAAAALPLTGDSARAFVTVWGLHIGTYAGAAMGLIGAATGVWRRKRRVRTAS